MVMEGSSVLKDLDRTCRISDWRLEGRMGDKNGKHNDGTTHSSNISSIACGWLKILSICHWNDGLQTNSPVAPGMPIKLVMHPYKIIRPKCQHRRFQVKAAEINWASEIDWLGGLMVVAMRIWDCTCLSKLQVACLQIGNSQSSAITLRITSSIIGCFWLANIWMALKALATHIVVCGCTFHNLLVCSYWFFQAMWE